MTDYVSAAVEIAGFVLVVVMVEQKAAEDSFQMLLVCLFVVEALDFVLVELSFAAVFSAL